MNCEIQTEYTPVALSAMARALRKTQRKGRSLVAHILGTCLILMCVFLAITPHLVDESQSIGYGTLAISLILLLIMLFEDRLNGYLAYKRMLPGSKTAVTVFGEESYDTRTDGAVGKWEYSRITEICRTKRYYIFVMGKNHGQAFDREGFLQGTEAELEALLQEKTGLQIKDI